MGLGKFFKKVGGTAKNVLFGERGEGSRYIDLDPTLKAVTDEARQGQLDVAKSYRDIFKNYDSGGMARMNIANEARGLITSAEDQERMARRAVAQRGLGRSAAGLSAILNAGQDQRQEASRLRATAPLRAMQQRLGITQATGAGLSQLLAAPGQQRTYVQGDRRRPGGLANVFAKGLGQALGMGATGGMGAAASAAQGGGASAPPTAPYSNSNMYQPGRYKFNYGR